jgi:hypothetical protein
MFPFPFSAKFFHLHSARKYEYPPGSGLHDPLPGLAKLFSPAKYFYHSGLSSQLTEKNNRALVNIFRAIDAAIHKCQTDHFAFRLK